MPRRSATGTTVPAARRWSFFRTRRHVANMVMACGCLVGALLAAAEPCGAQGVSATSELRLPKLFADGMVMQRDVPLPVWGWAAPGTTVTVTLAGNTARGAANAAGAWTVTLPPMRGGGPHEITVQSSATKLQVRNVLIGDVWIASGQSNMEWPVRMANDSARVIAMANDSALRHFKVPTSWAESPADELVGGSWAPATPQNVGAFTAVGYFFARELRKSVNVPIGLINTSWGGSNIETWLSREAHGLNEGAAAALLKRERESLEAIRDSLTARLGTLPTKDVGLVDGRAVWANPELDDASWSTIRVPSLWEDAGYPGLDGIVWLRLAFTLSAEEAKQSARLSLGPIDDNDITWVNGVEVGRTSGYATPREYVVPTSALRSGRNVITVRVSDGGGGGGIYGNPDLIHLSLGGVRRPLTGTWKLKVGEASVRMDGQRINKVPMVLYNQMVHPLQRFPVKGVVWYQGESNANNVAQAVAYRDLFAKLITSWRREWVGTHDFPFLWVQLPNFNPPDSIPPARSAWATQRESMAAALALPNTGQAITIDVGEATDIHPRNKQDVGARLARVARKVVYGQSVVASGPTYRRHTIQGGRVSVEFDNVAGGLVSRGREGLVGGFAVAGADGRFVWAKAHIEDGRVVVWSDAVREPVAVRYAWADNPSTASLYNREGLPAAPFRTDTWP